MEQSASWEVNSSSASQEILAFYGNQNLISMFTRSRHLSLFWARSIQSTSSSLPISSYQFYIAYVVPKNLFKYKAFWTIRGMLFLRWGVFGRSPNAQAGGPHIVSCPRLLIQYTRSCRPSATWGYTLSWWQNPLMTDKFVQVFEVRISKIVHDSYRPCWYGLC